MLLSGSCGQSLGAFLVQGIELDVTGDANDYVGKGLSGGLIALKPRPQDAKAARANAIIGNTCLYGATAANCSPPVWLANVSQCAIPARPR